MSSSIFPDLSVSCHGQRLGLILGGLLYYNQNPRMEEEKNQKVVRYVMLVNN